MKKGKVIGTVLAIAMVGTVGVIGFQQATWKPKTSEITVSYTNVGSVTAESFVGKDSGQLTIDMEREVGSYIGVIRHCCVDHEVVVNVVDTVTPTIVHKKEAKVQQGQKVKNWTEYVVGYDEIDGIVEVKVGKVDWNKIGKQTVEITATDKSGNEFKDHLDIEITKKPENKKKKEQTATTTSTPVNGVTTPQTIGNVYSYRSLGKTTLSTKDFGKDTAGLQSALDSTSSCQVADYNTALKYVNTLHQNYGVVASIVSGRTKNGTVTNVVFQTQNGNNYNKQIDQLAHSICGTSGTTQELLSRICEYERTHFTYVSGQNNVQTLLSTNTGNCDSYSRFMVDILARYGLSATQIGQNGHAWVQVNGYYSDPTFYATSGGNGCYIVSSTVWNDSQH